MDIIVRKVDIYFTAIVFAGIAGVLLHHAWDRIQIHSELSAFAQNSVNDLLSGEELDQWDVISVISQAKTFHVCGPAWGAIHTFVRRKGDEDMASFKGIEYYLKRVDGRWVTTDSAGCGALEHHVDGFEEFEKRGLRVSTAAYDRALGYRHDHAEHAQVHVHPQLAQPGNAAENLDEQYESARVRRYASMERQMQEHVEGEVVND